MACLAVVAAGNVKAQAVGDLTRVQDTLTAAEEARCKAKVEATRIEVERTSLMLEIGAAKDEVSSPQSQTNKDKEAME